MNALDHMTTEQLEELTVPRLVRLCAETGMSISEAIAQIVARTQTGEHDR